MINNNCYIDALIPELSDKNNSYCEPTEKLHIFDFITVIYHDGSNELVLLEDVAEFIVEMLKNSLQSAFIGKQILPSHIDLGKASLSFSLDEQSDNDEIDYTIFWLWSSPTRVQTWLYTRDNKIYLEISSTYPWLFVDPEPSENYYSFDEYIKNYKPIAVYEISRETAQQWLEQCNTMLDTMDAPPGYTR
jgi:hypothetical protein